MLIARIVGERLKGLQLCSVDSSHDMTNAFACTLHSSLEDQLESSFAVADRVFVKQRIRNSTGTLHTNDGILTFLVGTGSMMGTSEAPRQFLKAFTAPVRNLNMRVHDKQLIVKCSITGMIFDSSLVTFADDLWKKLLVPDGSAASAHNRVMESNSILDCQLDGHGFAQNCKKQVVVPMLRPRTENVRLRALADGRYLVKGVWRHLGGLYSWNGSNKEERGLRLKALTKGWWELGSFWHSASPWSVKRLMFMC